MASQMLWSPKKSHREDLMAQKGKLGTPGMSKEQKQQAMGRAATAAGQQAGAQQREVARTGLATGGQPGQFAQAQEAIAKQATEAAAAQAPAIEAESARIAAERDAQTRAALEREYDRRLSLKMQKKAMRKSGGSGGMMSGAGQALGGVGMDKILGMIGS